MKSRVDQKQLLCFYEKYIQLTTYLNCKIMQSSSDVFTFIFKLITVLCPLDTVNY